MGNRTSGMVRLLAGCVLAVAAMPSAGRGAEPPLFVEETSVAGIDHSYTGGFEYFVGGGVAALDCDADGFVDLFFAGGAGVSSLYRNVGAPGGPLRFAPVAAPEARLSGVSGAYPLDVDGDGLTDLAVLRVGENVLLRGRGGCRFARANEAWGFDGGDAWSTAFTATWERGADWPTLAVGNYIDRARPGAPFGTCHDNVLYRPAAAGRAFAPREDLRPGHCSLSALFSDWNRSGVAALRFSNDRQYYRGGQEQLWQLSPGDPARLFTAAEGWRQLRIWGMGIASYDVTGDGYPDYLLTSMGDNKLRALGPGGPGSPTYGDLAFARGLTAHRPFAGDEDRPSTGWHADFQDVNNDGLIDLFIAKGNVEAMVDFAARDPNNLLIGQPDGTFVEGAAAAGIISHQRARGAAVVDLNLDGLLDLVVVNREAPAQLWRNRGLPNRGLPGNWLAVRLRQDGANRNAVGAWVEVRAGARTWRRELTVGGGHAGGVEAWMHFGLGAASQASVRVQWPDGTSSDGTSSDGTSSDGTSSDGTWSDGTWSDAMAVAVRQWVIVDRVAGPVPWQQREANN